MDELLSLKWNNHRSTFLHILTILRDKQAYTDVTLACDGKFYNVHKLVLSTCSDYFSAMFDKTDKTCKSPIIVLKDIKCEDLEALLDYMYIGEVNVRQCDLASLIKSAECLRIKGLAVPDDEPPKKVPNRTDRTDRTDSNRTDRTDSNRTDRTDSNRTDSNRPDSNRPDSNRPDSNRPDSNRPDSNKTESNRRDNVSGSPPPKRKRREEVEDGRDDVRPIEPSPQPSISRPKNESSQRLSPPPQRTPPSSAKVEDRLSRPTPSSVESHPLPSTSGTSGGGGGGDSGGGGASGGSGEQFRSQSQNQTEVKVEVIDDIESHDDSQLDSYDMGADGYKEESEGDYGDLSNDLPEFLQAATSGAMQGSSYHQYPGPSGFQDASGSSWQGDGQSLGGNFSGLGFSHQDGSQNPGVTSGAVRPRGHSHLSSSEVAINRTFLNVSKASDSGIFSESAAAALGITSGTMKWSSCPICNKIFRGDYHKYNLKKHMTIHAGLKPFLCPFCPQSFNQKVSMKRHIIAFHKCEGDLDSTSNDMQNELYILRDK